MCGKEQSRRAIRPLVATIAALMLAAGCGNDDDSSPNAPEPPASERSGRDKADGFDRKNAPGLSVSEKDVYDLARGACGAFPAKQVARDFGLQTTDPDVIASRYARGYDAQVKQAANQGCFDGLTER